MPKISPCIDESALLDINESKFGELKPCPRLTKGKMAKSKPDWSGNKIPMTAKPISKRLILRMGAGDILAETGLSSNPCVRAIQRPRYPNKVPISP